jgi:ferredoxin-type protein NapG
MKRRNFLKQLVVGAATFGALVFPYGISRVLSPRANIPKKNYQRPPGALKDDAKFVDACIGCGLCGEVCPPRCIQFHSRTGGNGVNTPYVDASVRACTLCGKCTEICPTLALTPTPREFVDMGIAQIDRSACYPWVDRGICGACVSVCPLGEKGIAFKMWNQYRPIIQTGCVGCGLCVEVCPHPSKPIWIIDKPLERSQTVAG